MHPLQVTASRLILVLAAVCARGAWAQPDVPLADEESAGRILEVRVENNRRVEQPAVARALKQKVGQPFQASRTAEDLRALWALKYFDDIQLLVQRTPTGVIYVVRVTEKPAIRKVTLKGNEELAKDDFKEVIDLKENSILDPNAVRRNVKKIQEKYVEKGFFLAEVSSRVVPTDDPTEVDVDLVVQENAKVQVKEITFIGANKVPAAELKGAMQTKEGTIISFLTQEGVYREEVFQRDLQILQFAFYDRGYVNARIDKPIVTISPDKQSITILIKVEEGEQFTFGKIDFSGDLILPKEELFKRLSSATGQTFSSSQLRRDIQAVTDAYYDEGYAYANIIPATQVNAEARTLDLTFDISKGRQVYIERIDLSGNTKTRDRVIRRELRVYEGELFNGSGLRRSKDKVTALGFFETVEVNHKPGRDDEHVVVTVEVKEKSTGTFQVGLGFSNIENFIFTAQIQQQNFLGWGQAVSLSAQISGLRQFFQASFFEPYLFDQNLILSVDGYRTQLDFFDFIRDAYGGSASLGYYLLPSEMSVSAGYLLEWVNVSTRQPLQLANLYNSGRTSALRLNFTWDRRNNRLFPTSGFFTFAQAEIAPSFFGSSYEFIRWSANQRVYIPLPLGIVFKFQAQFGYIQELNPAARLPASELFYAGGINTIRGYPIRTVTPNALAVGQPDGAPRNLPVGGDKQFIFNAELEFPILERVGIRGVLFYDAGNVFGANQPFFVPGTDDPLTKGLVLPLGLLHSVGFGVRWFSPIGPLRFEWGIPLIRRPSIDQPIQFEFNIGQSF